MKKLIIIIGLLLLLGCQVMDEMTLNSRKSGIIQSCYTVLQNNPEDKKERIQIYLQKKYQQGQITLEQKEIITKCLERTENSKRWSK